MQLSNLSTYFTSYDLSLVKNVSLFPYFAKLYSSPFRVLDHMTQNIICPEFFNHELHGAKDSAAKQTSDALANPTSAMLEEVHKVGCLSFNVQGTKTQNNYIVGTFLNCFNIICCWNCPIYLNVE